MSLSNMIELVVTVLILGFWIKLSICIIVFLMSMTFLGLGGLIAQSLEEQLFRWLRAAELTCDRAALLVAQDPKVYEC
jgi:hypothetical protein